MAEPSKPPPHLADRIGHKAARHQRARERPKHGLWFGLGMFGLVGWSVAIPTVLGIALGIWLDRKWPGPPSWTLTLLFLGVILGCRNAWYWIERERHDNHTDKRS
ncbi:AtpZ/AtpI family protein [Methylomonas methanica]|uniref:F0F1-ATPase subunit n=1 Tax=Methylomonas methanica (strain DSM 25384 / MC09) TaxID=857087 RepID=G0A2D2_METMM|nr:AtpZ/AtpI family protein [Methylomonas methanica]AEF98944.1 F0F1-ATPase subunit [Methylomonas methanica MC09]